MAASIQRYSDPRLHGAALVTPFDLSYEWIRSVANPLHPRLTPSELVTELAVRALKIFTGALALALTALLALIGRIIQIIHYHTLTESEANNPDPIPVNGMQLPKLEACSIPHAEKFHGTKRAGAIGILRWGFDPARTTLGAKMFDATYISTSDICSAAYGEDQLILSLDLRPGEVAYASDENLQAFARDAGYPDLGTKEAMAAVRQLFIQNGYRAIRYDLDHPVHGRQEAWAIYDQSCITITAVRPSPDAAPQPLLLAYA